MNTTLNELRKHHPCSYGWRKLLTYLGKTEADDEPLPLRTILESNGLEDTLWALRAAKSYDERALRLYAVWYARQVQHLMNDPRSVSAVNATEKFANGLISEDTLADARKFALKAWRDAWNRVQLGNPEDIPEWYAARTAYYVTENNSMLENPAAKAVWYAHVEANLATEAEAQLAEDDYIYYAYMKAQKAKLVEFIEICEACI